MSCEKYKSRIADFAAADVAAAFRPADVSSDPDLAAHLKSCASCRTAHDTQRALLASIDRGLASMVAGEPSGDFAAQVRHRIAQEGVTPRPWFAGWMPVTAAALTLVFLVGVLTIGRPPRPPQSAEMTARKKISPLKRQKEAAPPSLSVRTEAPPSVARGPRPPHEGQMAANREPEVLVPRSEMEAFLRFYQPVRDGQADASSLLARATLASEPIRPLTTTEIKIPLLEIEPLTEERKQKGSSERR